MQYSIREKQGLKRMRTLGLGERRTRALCERQRTGYCEGGGGCDLRYTFFVEGRGRRGQGGDVRQNDSFDSRDDRNAVEEENNGW